MNIKIKSKIIIAASIAVMSSCAKNNTESDNSLSRQDEVPSEIASLIPAKDFLESLKTHCAACHNIGEYRFFHAWIDTSGDLDSELQMMLLKTIQLRERNFSRVIIQIHHWLTVDNSARKINTQTQCFMNEPLAKAAPKRAS